MAIEQDFPESVVQSNFNKKDGPSLEKWNSVSAPISESESVSSGGFECNICLDSVQDPVVTFCGHLFCWPCIYKWINFQSTSTESQGPQCPVCKADVSQRALVPLYGRGQTTKQSKPKSENLGIAVPQRPSPIFGVDALMTPPSTYSTHQVHPHYRHHDPRRYPYRSESYRPYPMLDFGDVAMTGMVNPVVSMFGEMIYSRIFGGSESLYTYPDSYHLAWTSSPRVRRHLVQVDQSLGRVCFFLFCCMVLCLLSF